MNGQLRLGVQKYTELECRKPFIERMTSRQIVGTELMHLHFTCDRCSSFKLLFSYWTVYLVRKYQDVRLLLVYLHLNWKMMLLPVVQELLLTVMCDDLLGECTNELSLLEELLHHIGQRSVQLWLTSVEEAKIQIYIYSEGEVTLHSTFERCVKGTASVL